MSKALHQPFTTINMLLEIIRIIIKVTNQKTKVNENANVNK